MLPLNTGHLWSRAEMHLLAANKIPLGAENTTETNVTRIPVVKSGNECGALLQRNLQRKIPVKQRGGQDEGLSCTAMLPQQASVKTQRTFCTALPQDYHPLNVPH